MGNSNHSCLLFRFAVGASMLAATSVFAGNTPPAISAISNKLMQLGGALPPVSFTIQDAETPASSLILAAASTNLALVPVGNISFGGGDSNRTITITPSTGQSGRSLITIYVSDGLETNSTSFLFTVNRAPQLQLNDTLGVNQGGSGVITSSLLRVNDSESVASLVTYTIAPGNQGGCVRNGILRLNGTPLDVGSTFTQQNVNDGLLTYQNNNSCETKDDFTFNANDGTGGVTPTGQFTTFTFRISITRTDNSPVAFDGLASVPLNGFFRGSLAATNPDCLAQTFTYRVVTNGLKGTLTITNTSTGGFVYTVNPNQTGADTVFFQVNDGVHDATNAGVYSFLIENQRPVAHAATLNAQQNVVMNGTLAATDTDLPAQVLTFSLIANASKGTVVITNATTGGFTFTPQPGRFGLDNFSFKVNDGSLTSAPATISLWIQHPLTPGDLLVTDGGNKLVAAVDPRTADVVPITFEGYLSGEMFGLTVEPSGTILVADSANGIVRINPITGGQSIAVSNSFFAMPFNVKVEATGDILVSDIGTGLHRFNSDGTLLTNFPPGLVPHPAGLFVADDGVIFATDPEAAAPGGNPASNKVVRIDPITLDQTVISVAGHLTVPTGVAVEPNGQILISDGGSLVPGAGIPDRILRINPADGSQTVLTSGNFLSFPAGLVLTPDGDIFTANANGSIVKIDTLTGVQTVVLPSGLLERLNGIALVPGTLPKPTMSVPERTDAGFRLTFTGVPGRSYQLQKSITLTNAIWTPVITLAAPLNGVMNYEDVGEPEASAFYRIVMQ